MISDIGSEIPVPGGYANGKHGAGLKYHRCGQDRGAKSKGAEIGERAYVAT